MLWTSSEGREERLKRLRAGLKTYADAGVYGRLTYSFVGSLLSLGAVGGIDEDVGPELLPANNRAEVLSETFDALYQQVSSRPGLTPAAIMWRTYLKVYRIKILVHLLWAFAEVGCRVGSPLILRKLITWFWGWESSGGDAAAFPAWQGWLWSGLLALMGYLYCAVHHQLFWKGMRNGFTMRLQAIAAVQAKVLRLNAAGVAAVTAGKIVNLVSNDVRRFDEAGTFGVFLIAGPVELAIVLVLIGLKMGFAASVAGGLLGRRIVRLRHATALQTDERVKLTSEALSGVLAAKMLGWEDGLLARIHAVRGREQGFVRAQARIRALNMGLAFAISPVAALITFATARGTGHVLTVANVFYTIALLQLPKLYMADFFVKSVEALSELRVSMARIGKFLCLAEPPPPYHHVSSAAPGTLLVPGLDFDWEVLPWAQGSGAYGGVGAGNAREKTGQNEDAQGGQGERVDTQPNRDPGKLTLRGIRLESAPGRLIGVIGEVGSGKSSLLSVLLGELQPTAGGGVDVGGRVAYVSQVPWTVAGTVKENILFGGEEDPDFYARVVQACALGDDLAMLPGGDAAELGERGVNLSGGQRARLSLARAAYSRAEVQLLDDPLSAVDPRVGRTLFEACIGPGGVMAGATRVLATHQTQHLAACDEVLVMRGGAIAERGTMAQLAARGVPEAAAMHEAALDDATYDGQLGSEDEEVGEVDDEGVAAHARPGDETQDAAQDAECQTDAAPASRPERAPDRTPAENRDRDEARPGRHPSIVSRLLAKVTRRRLIDQGSSFAEAAKPSMAAAGTLILAEEREIGSVDWHVYGAYCGYMTWSIVITIAAAMFVGQGVYLYGDYWIAVWSSKSEAEQQEAFWIWGYAIMVSCVLAISLVRAQLFFHYTLVASSAMHHAMIERVMRAPLSFFHTNPTGRVLNRFSKDQGAVDDQLPTVAFDAIQAAMIVLGCFVLLMVVVPFIIPIFIPLGIAFVLVYRRYVCTSREVKRFEATSRSPVYASFSALLKGLPSIRAYAAAPRFRARFLRDLSDNGAWWFVFVTCARWVGFRLDLLVALLMTAAPLLMMGVHDSLSARLVGLGLSQSLQLGGMLQWAVRQASEVENHMTSVERMLAYTRLPQEPPTLAQGGPPPPKGWPGAGMLQYDDVTAVYREGLPPVLHDLSFTLEGGLSCGVVGRTGSGKSSLLLTLFRLIPVTHGAIRLGGVDTARLALDALRRQIAIIPQDPVLFSGSLRGNLDPWNAFDDHRLWEVLGAVQLGPVVRALGGLEGRMQEAGDNLSVGQRQLFCLARALLQGASILALDEATANVDRATDVLIQEAVRTFSKTGAGDDGRARRTVLVIAHRIHTIMDCDRLLVLSDGHLVESGEPGFLARGRGVFSRLVRAAGAGGGRA
ncbi:hypothetical protein APUTEX25_000832 [Auxenochlorella protothecoides]|uniref:Uncharacterized protein n=1 Tax=Auxenochlorella protothecoides TaxID=3075 RepID=A0A3M7KQA1_AUXPR|nr:hypothetical protein APUTEX25_000832 [Auxenochlorella protothecoides]|eukprot:RMZ52713.1 hypothetical protein APUTEX25_000832 [Auxenochlorella protothecoides]